MTVRIFLIVMSALLGTATVHAQTPTYTRGQLIQFTNDCTLSLLKLLYQQITQEKFPLHSNDHPVEIFSESRAITYQKPGMIHILPLASMTHHHSDCGEQRCTRMLTFFEQTGEQFSLSFSPATWSYRGCCELDGSSDTVRLVLPNADALPHYSYRIPDTKKVYNRLGNELPNQESISEMTIVPGQVISDKAQLVNEETSQPASVTIDLEEFRKCLAEKVAAKDGAPVGLEGEPKVEL